MSFIRHEIISICKGGGYRYARTNPVHPKANVKGLYPYHRVLMENHLGRYLEDWEDVHHKDEDKTNDDISNLEVRDHSQHQREHRVVDLVAVECCSCGKTFELKPHQFRLRIKRSKTGKIRCSRNCNVGLTSG